VLCCASDGRCVVRYGYKDIHKDDYDFENQLVINLAEFVRTEGEVSWIPSSSEVSADGRMAVMGSTRPASTVHALWAESDFEESFVSTHTVIGKSPPATNYQVWTGYFGIRTWSSDSYQVS
jgi:hypothetical protein